MACRYEAFIASSVDGYIARNNGDLDWLDNANQSVPKNEDCGYKSFMDDVDTIVMGRKTYEKVLSFDIDWPYKNHKTYILSRNKIEIPKNLNNYVVSFNKSINELHRILEQNTANKVYIDGGKTIQSYIQSGLLKYLTVTMIPVLIGSGISLFGSLEHKDIQLKLIYSKEYSFGFVQLKYELVYS